MTPEAVNESLLPRTRRRKSFLFSLLIVRETPRQQLQAGVPIPRKLLLEADG